MDNFATRLDRHTIQFIRILPGPIEKIWAYIADGKKRSEWFASGDLPAKVGEPFEMRFKHSDYSPHKSPAPESHKDIDAKGHAAQNILLKLAPPHLLAFTFGPMTHGGETSEVEFRLAEEGDPKNNLVRLTLTHSKIPDRAFMLSVSGGWHSHLDILEYKAQGKTPPAFWDVWRRYEGVYDKRYR